MNRFSVSEIPLLFPCFLLEQEITNSYASLNGLFIELLTEKMPNLKVENYLLFGKPEGLSLDIASQLEETVPKR